MPRAKKGKRIDAERKDWQQEVDRKQAALKPRKAKFKNLSNIEVNDLYTPLDVPDLDYGEDLGFPGRYPYTRGVYPTMYRSNPWTVRQVTGYSGGAETSERLRFMMGQGQTGFSVVFDHPTNMGLDSDHPASEGFVGREGTAIDTIYDMRDLLAGVDLEKASLNLITGNPAVFAMALAVAEERKVDQRNLAGTLQVYPLIGHTMGSAGYYQGGSLFYGKRFCTDIAEYCARNLPRWNSISVAVRNTRDGGCNAVQEMAFGVGSGLAIVRACQERGIDPDDVAPRISFFLNSHRDFFEEVAKFRAMRRLWARILREEIGAKNPRSWMMRFHCQTSGDAMTRQQPLVNIVRGTLHGFAAVLGGCQSLHINSADEGYAIPTEDTAKLSLRTHQVILDESGAADVIDPLGGSYYVEALTNRMEQEAKDILARLDAIGEWFDPAVQKWVSDQISDTSYNFQQEVERGERVVIGVNKYIEDEGGKLHFPIWKEDKGFVDRHVARLQRIRKERDPRSAAAAEKNLFDACRRGDNIVPPTVEAVKAFLSTGEITATYKKAIGTD